MWHGLTWWQPWEMVRARFMLAPVIGSGQPECESWPVPELSPTAVLPLHVSPAPVVLPLAPATTALPLGVVAACSDTLWWVPEWRGWSVRVWLGGGVSCRLQYPGGPRRLGGGDCSSLAQSLSMNWELVKGVGRAPQTSLLEAGCAAAAVPPPPPPLEPVRGVPRS